jgi:hypothetical protein
VKGLLLIETLLVLLVASATVWFVVAIAMEVSGAPQHAREVVAESAQDACVSLDAPGG